MQKLINVEAKSLPDAWFQLVYKALEHGRKFKIDKGSYAGSHRYEFDFILAHIEKPGLRDTNGLPLIPEMAEGMTIPAPVDYDYMAHYAPYIMENYKEIGESYCYSDDTKILSENGWKYFKDLELDEMVASLNPKTGKVEYQIPEEHVEFDYDGDIYEFDNRKINFSVNPGHKIYVGSANNHRSCANSHMELTPIDNILDFKFLKFKRKFKYDGVHQKYFILPKVEYNNPRYKKYGKALKILMEDWLKFFGIWIAEGDLGNYKDKNAYPVRLSISNSEDRKTVKKWCEKLFIVTEYKRWLIINNKQLFDYLKQFKGAFKKYIPVELKKLSKEQLKILFNSMMLGDGNKDGSKYTTVSEKLAQDFSEICAKIGKHGNITIDRHISSNGFKQNGITYRIIISNKYLEPTVRNKIKKKKYNGKLYCVRLARHHILFIQRNGKSHWSGNTYGQRLRGAQFPVYLLEEMKADLKNKIFKSEGDFLYSEKSALDGSYNEIDQVDTVIKTYKTGGHRNNQMCMEIAQPNDITLKDPPCLRSIDTRIQDGMLHFYIYFRSWDLWGGLPSNLAGISLLQEYMANEIGVECGEFICTSKGLHLYDHALDIAQIRCCKEWCEND